MQVHEESSLAEELAAKLKSLCNLDADYTFDDQPFAEKGFDSLTLIRFLSWIEDHYGLEISDEEAYRAYSFTRLTELIKRKMEAGDRG